MASQINHFAVQIKQSADFICVIFEITSWILEQCMLCSKKNANDLLSSCQNTLLPKLRKKVFIVSLDKDNFPNILNLCSLFSPEYVQHSSALQVKIYASSKRLRPRIYYIRLFLYGNY